MSVTHCHIELRDEQPQTPVACSDRYLFLLTSLDRWRVLLIRAALGGAYPGVCGQWWANSVTWPILAVLSRVPGASAGTTGLTQLCSRWCLILQQVSQACSREAVAGFPGIKWKHTGLLRSSLRTGSESLPYSIGQGNSRGRARLKDGGRCYKLTL